MASKKSDKHADDGHSGGEDHKDTGASGEKHAKKAATGTAAANVLRNPVTWALGGVAALAALLFSGILPTAPVGTSPTSYSPDSTTIAENDGGTGSPSQRATRRTARLNAGECYAIVQEARADNRREWERQLTSKVRKDCARTIQEARWVDGRTPLQVEASRTRTQSMGDTEIVRVSVAYSDLDLSTPSGAASILDRVRRAAMEACGGQPDLRDLAAQRPFKECVDRSMDGAIAQLRAPRVTALYRQPG